METVELRSGLREAVARDRAARGRALPLAARADYGRSAVLRHRFKQCFRYRKNGLVQIKGLDQDLPVLHAINNPHAGATGESAEARANVSA